MEFNEVASLEARIQELEKALKAEKDRRYDAELKASNFEGLANAQKSRVRQLSIEKAAMTEMVASKSKHIEEDAKIIGRLASELVQADRRGDDLLAEVAALKIRNAKLEHIHSFGPIKRAKGWRHS